MQLCRIITSPLTDLVQNKSKLNFINLEKENKNQDYQNRAIPTNDANFGGKKLAFEQVNVHMARLDSLDTYHSKVL